MRSRYNDLKSAFAEVTLRAAAQFGVGGVISYDAVLSSNNTGFGKSDAIFAFE